MLIYRKRLDIKIFLHPTKVSKRKLATKKGVKDSNWIYWSILKGGNFRLMGWEPRHVINFPASRSKETSAPLLNSSPGLLKFFWSFRRKNKKPTKCWQGNVLPPKQLSRILRDFAGIFCFHPSVGSECSWLVESWGPRSNGSETASLRLKKPRSSPGVKFSRKFGDFFSAGKMWEPGPLLILKMGMFFQREQKGFLLACAVKIFEVGLESVVLYSMAFIQCVGKNQRLWKGQ